MSIQAIAWVLDHSEAEGIDRLVLICLANHFNGRTGDCDPGMRLVAREARVGTSTVARSVARLEELGELRVDRGKGTATNKYHFPRLVDNGLVYSQRDTVEGSSVPREGRSVPRPPSSVPPERDETLHNRKQNRDPEADAYEVQTDGSGIRAFRDAVHPPLKASSS